MWRTVVGVVSDVRYRGDRRGAARCLRRRPADRPSGRQRGRPDVGRPARRGVRGPRSCARARSGRPSSTTSRRSTWSSTAPRRRGGSRCGCSCCSPGWRSAWRRSACSAWSRWTSRTARREFAIRMALGAPRPTILLSVLLARRLAGRGRPRARPGRCRGREPRPCAACSSGWRPTMARRTRPCSALVAAAVALAAYLPARRVARIDPQVLLRRP